jgi:hypothetical protein
MSPGYSAARRLVVSFGTLSLLSLAAACSSKAECAATGYVEPVLTGSLPDIQVSATDVKQFYACFGQVCGSEVSQRLTLAFDPALPASGFADDSGVAPAPRKLELKYALDVASGYSPKTGDVLRLRVPNNPQGPWSFDVSLRADVTPAGECSSAHGTLTRVP